MYKILTLNNISVEGLAKLPRERYEVGSDIESPDAIMLRSFKMHDMPIPASLKAVARAGAGVNNVPVGILTEMGIPVFNAPGANANAVKELVLAGMLLACRNICQAWDFVRHLEGDDASLSKQAEAGKKQFVGFELPGKTLGVIGLGAIGVMVANAAKALGMDVIGYDPKITVQAAWRLSADVRQAISVDDLLAQSDFVTFHVPLVESTKHLINRESIRGMRDGAVVLNFSREGIVDNEAVGEALNAGKLYAYVTDFANNALKGHERVIILPHLGASTRQAEDNCAVMVAEQVRDFLENGNIRNSVNFPEVVMPMSNGARIAIANANVPNMVGQISTTMAQAGLNINDLLNKSRDQIAYTLVDVDESVPPDVIEKLRAIDGVLNVRLIP
ncbi:MAG: 3-phosphoglycerate dehydrogenase [Gammaproteobacteria bacterium]|nr:3-phosphoglycerate dehydrogenase [Gammaproteobacteria bacterium]